MQNVNTAKQEQIKQIHNTFTLLMRLSKRWFAQWLQSFNLTLPQFVTLATLVAHKQACTMSDLTNVTFQDPPTTTGIVDRLFKAELVARKRSQQDRRVVLVEATPTGIELVNKIEALILEEAAAGYNTLSDQELATLERLLRHLLHTHLTLYTPIHDFDIGLDQEKLEHFVQDPIYYMKLESEKAV